MGQKGHLTLTLTLPDITAVLSYAPMKHQQHWPSPDFASAETKLSCPVSTCMILFCCLRLSWTFCTSQRQHADPLERRTGEQNIHPRKMDAQLASPARLKAYISALKVRKYINASRKQND